MNSEALIKFLASLNPEQHDTLITLLKRCLPAEQSAATWPRHAATVTAGKCPAHCTSLSLLRYRASSWCWQHPSRPSPRSSLCYRLQLCAAKKLKSLGLLHSHFIMYARWWFMYTRVGCSVSKILCCTLHFLSSMNMNPSSSMGVLLIVDWQEKLNVDFM